MKGIYWMDVEWGERERWGGRPGNGEKPRQKEQEKRESRERGKRGKRDREKRRKREIVGCPRRETKAERAREQVGEADGLYLEQLAQLVT